MGEELKPVQQVMPEILAASEKHQQVIQAIQHLATRKETEGTFTSPEAKQCTGLTQKSVSSTFKTLTKLDIIVEAPDVAAIAATTQVRHYRLTDYGAILIPPKTDEELLSIMSTDSSEAARRQRLLDCARCLIGQTRAKNKELPAEEQSVPVFASVSVARCLDGEHSNVRGSLMALAHERNGYLEVKSDEKIKGRRVTLFAPTKKLAKNGPLVPRPNCSEKVEDGKFGLNLTSRQLEMARCIICLDIMGKTCGIDYPINASRIRKCISSTANAVFSSLSGRFTEYNVVEAEPNAPQGKRPSFRVTESGLNVLKRELHDKLDWQTACFTSGSWPAISRSGSGKSASNASGRKSRRRSKAQPRPTQKKQISEAASHRKEDNELVEFSKDAFLRELGIRPQTSQLVSCPNAIREAIKEVALWTGSTDTPDQIVTKYGLHDYNADQLAEFIKKVSSVYEPGDVPRCELINWIRGTTPQ